MKYIFYFAFCSLVLFGCTVTKNSSIESNLKPTNYFLIEIEQDGKIIPQNDNLVKLKKKPFKFKVTLNGVEDVFVSSSWGKFYYDFPDEKNIFECNSNESFKDCRFVSIKTGVQDKFNVEKDLSVGDGDYQQVWFYLESIDWHRFDKGVVVNNGIVNAEMTVENIFDCDLRDKRIEDSKHEYKVEEIDKDIYMVFASGNYDREKKHTEELQREKFIIKFK